MKLNNHKIETIDNEMIGFEKEGDLINFGMEKRRKKRKKMSEKLT